MDRLVQSKADFYQHNFDALRNDWNASPLSLHDETRTFTRSKRNKVYVHMLADIVKHLLQRRFFLLDLDIKTSPMVSAYALTDFLNSLTFVELYRDVQIIDKNSFRKKESRVGYGLTWLFLYEYDQVYKELRTEAIEEARKDYPCNLDYELRLDQELECRLRLLIDAAHKTLDKFFLGCSLMSEMDA